jgi:hypothetical protein
MMMTRLAIHRAMSKRRCELVKAQQHTCFRRIDSPFERRLPHSVIQIVFTFLRAYSHRRLARTCKYLNRLSHMKPSLLQHVTYNGMYLCSAVMQWLHGIHPDCV